MLAPMPIASNLGLTPLPSRTIAPMASSSETLRSRCRTALGHMAAHGATADLDATTNGAALAAVIKSWPGEARPRFAVVHPYSGHNYELRYWLAACGVDPELDIEIVILPPPFMPEALASGALDGYCVGAPWNAAAVALGVGHIATAKAPIWQSSPEKVLGAQEQWAEGNPDALAALFARFIVRRVGAPIPRTVRRSRA